MSRVLLGHSYFLRFDVKLWRAMQPYPPLGTLYAAAILREAGHEVRLFDAMLAESTEGWTRMLNEQRPDVAVLFEDNFNYLSKMCLLNMRQASFEMIDAARRAGCPVIVAGADVTDHADDYLSRGATVAVLGEGEATVVEVIGALETGSDIAAISGLAYRTETDETRYTGLRPVITDLDALPAPDRSLVDIDAYRRAWGRHSRFSMNLVASRGCSFHCNWCAKPIWGQRHHARSPASVAREIGQLQALGAEHIWFMDDILGIKAGWLADLADFLEGEGVRLPFKCLSRADLLLRPGEIEALRRAGCETVWLGAESGSQKVLDAMEKGTTVAQIREAAHRLKQSGIKPAFFLQFGYPGEDWDDVQATFDLVRQCEPDDIGISVSYPLPGTKFYERVKDSMRERANWYDSAEMPMLYDGPYSTSFYHRVFDAMHTEFRLRKATDGSGMVATALSLLLQGRAKAVLSLVRDAVGLPIARGWLERERQRSQPNLIPLPVDLDRTKAGQPSCEAES